MGNETRKCFRQRLKNGTFHKYLKGNGIDIGCGGDVLKIQYGTVIPYDQTLNPEYDAQYMNGMADEQFDFVYSSHCLEHLDDPEAAVRRWIDICKTGGHLYIVVPDESLYEKNEWPSRFGGAGHKWSFTSLKKSNLPKNIVVYDFFKKFDNLERITMFINDLNYDYGLPDTKDQTMMTACCHIEVILKKINGS